MLAGAILVSSFRDGDGGGFPMMQFYKGLGLPCAQRRGKAYNWPGDMGGDPSGGLAARVREPW